MKYIHRSFQYWNLHSPYLRQLEYYKAVLLYLQKIMSVPKWHKRVWEMLIMLKIIFNMINPMFLTHFLD